MSPTDPASTIQQVSDVTIYFAPTFPVTPTRRNCIQTSKTILEEENISNLKQQKSMLYRAHKKNKKQTM